jgi:hypothetical protein
MRRGESAKDRCSRRSREPRGSRVKTRSRGTPIVMSALSALHQIPQQIRSHRQLGERQATGSDLLD